MTRAITDNPERMGTEAAPGVPWEIAKNTDGPGIDWDPSMLHSRVSPETLDEFARVDPENADAIMDSYGYSSKDVPRNPEKPRPTQAPAASQPVRAGLKPPVDTSKAPDYSASGRDRFAVAIKQQIGFDPVRLDPYKEVQKAEARMLPKIFNQFFGGKVMWQDRERLNAQQKKAWEEEHLKFRSHVFNRAEQLKENGIAIMREGLDSFDRKAKEYSDIMSKVEKQIEADRKARETAPQMIGIVPLGKNQKTVHVWDRATGTYVDTGRPWSDTSTPQIIQQMDFEDKILGNYEPNQKLDPVDLQAMNDRRVTRGMPNIVEVQVKAPIKRSRFGIDWLAKDEKGEYQYLEEGSPELEQALAEGGTRTDSIREDVGGSAEASPTGSSAQILEQFPTAYQATDGKWYYTDDNGQTYRIEEE